MDVTCVLFGPLREAAGAKGVSLTVANNGSLRDVLDTLAGEYQALEGQLLTEEGDIQEGLVVTLDKRHANQLEGADTDVPANATIRITPSLQGG